MQKIFDGVKYNERHNITKVYTFDHLAGDRTPYTYLIGWSKLNLWYYGKRTAKGCHPNDLFKTYFTSSNVVKKLRQSNGDPDVITIHMIFNSISDCHLQEEMFLNTVNAKDNIKYLNMTNSGVIPKKDHLTGKAKAYMNGAYIGLVSCNYPRWSTGEIHGANKGKKLSNGPATSKARTGKKGHPTSAQTKEKISKKLKGISTKNKGFVTVKSLITGDTFNVSKEIFHLYNEKLFVSVAVGSKRKCGLVNVFDIIQSKFVRITSEEYNVNKSRYFTSRAAHKRGLV